MPTSRLLKSLFDYRSWANDELLSTLLRVDATRYAAQRGTALRLIEHYYLVDRIFIAHLSGEQQRIESAIARDIPLPSDLKTRLKTSDQWYEAYVATVTPETLAERIPFEFTDGDRGCMSREEMLLHVLTHSGYHRGEVGRVLVDTQVDLPWDTFAVFLHRAEPGRREEHGSKLSGRRSS
ncbi:DinB family protein [Variovorax sp. Sphag1AA]|uniref:DinB family protein n=1 Tax=Variovorax sp. Sphag1AA TaxID=2587027 RepID=UPI00161533D3|nr:DinB family protein [Variovorax sp. Sphag1AA]MBB3178639.1 putative damage-inducible protein DinB [Variovorax sp. Sphag1AA]